MSCRVCGVEGLVSVSRIRCGNLICSYCANQKRDADPVRYLTRRLADKLRRAGKKAPYPGIEFVRGVVEQHRGKSAISGVEGLENLCVTILDDGQAVLVTSGESRYLSLQGNNATLFEFLRTQQRN